MSEEILNLDYNRALLLLRILNMAKDDYEVSELSGLSLRTIYRDRRKYKIIKQKSQFTRYRWVIDGDLKEILNLK